MCMIFHQFKSRADAERFARDAAARFGVPTDVWNDHDEMAEAAAGVWPNYPKGRLVDVFPWQLTGPIALVERHDDLAVENEVCDFVAPYGGEFAGT